MSSCYKPMAATINCVSAVRLISPREEMGYAHYATGQTLAGIPSPEQALHDPNGLLAIGGDLQPARLLQAYQRGIFPGSLRES